MKRIFTLATFALMLIAPQNVAAQGTGMENGHEWVDLGLPSGTLWATCNIGADKPEKYGDYFAWGETEPKSEYTWGNYKWGKASNNITKYCNKSNYGKDEFTDTKTILDLEDDAARVNWGGNWCIPTEEDFQELIDNTVRGWKENYNETNVNGRLFTASNGNSIFLPAAGGTARGTIAGSSSAYWSGSLFTPSPDSAFNLWSASDGSGAVIHAYRHYGFTVRAVIKPNCATGVSSSCSSARQRNAPMYNLFGQKVGKDYKGIVIQNGRKLVKY